MPFHSKAETRFPARQAIRAFWFNQSFAVDEERRRDTLRQTISACYKQKSGLLGNGIDKGSRRRVCQPLCILPVRFEAAAKAGKPYSPEGPALAKLTCVLQTRRRGSHLRTHRRGSHPQTRRHGTRHAFHQSLHSSIRRRTHHATPSYPFGHRLRSEKRSGIRMKLR
jgi:hypothetical protein